MTWRRLHPGEIDHEVIWLGVTASSLLGAWAWLHVGLPTPVCVFHQLTGLPCPTCGMTRCLRFTFHHDWAAAVAINPLAFFIYGAIAVFDVYAAIVLLFRLPRFYLGTIPPRVGQTIRYASIAAILGNWAWLMWNGV